MLNPSSDEVKTNQRKSFLLLAIGAAYFLNFNALLVLTYRLSRTYFQTCKLQGLSLRSTDQNIVTSLLLTMVTE